MHAEGMEYLSRHASEPVPVRGTPISETIIEVRRQVAAYFFDSSALVKRYVVESGTHSA